MIQDTKASSLELVQELFSPSRIVVCDYQPQGARACMNAPRHVSEGLLALCEEHNVVNRMRNPVCECRWCAVRWMETWRKTATSQEISVLAALWDRDVSLKENTDLARAACAERVTESAHAAGQ